MKLPGIRAVLVVELLSAAVAMLSLNVAIAADEKPSLEKAASLYFEALMTGDVATANDLSQAPFSFDGKEILKTMEEVKEKHRASLGKKGKRNIPEYTPRILADESPLDPKVFPQHVVVRITVTGKGEHIDAYVAKGKTPKIIGFRD